MKLMLIRLDGQVFTTKARTQADAMETAFTLTARTNRPWTIADLGPNGWLAVPVDLPADDNRSPLILDVVLTELSSVTAEG